VVVVEASGILEGAVESSALTAFIILVGAMAESLADCEHPTNQKRVKRVTKNFIIVVSLPQFLVFSHKGTYSGMRRKKKRNNRIIKPLKRVGENNAMGF
jgi:hypothetical protein